MPGAENIAHYFDRSNGARATDLSARRGKRAWSTHTGPRPDPAASRGAAGDLAGDDLSHTRTWDEWAKLALDKRNDKRKASREAKRSRDHGGFDSLIMGETALSSDESAYDWGHFESETAAPEPGAADTKARKSRGGWFGRVLVACLMGIGGYDKSALAQPRVTLVTTLDSRLQAIAEDLIANADLGGAEAALVAMRRNGEVVAMIGGRDYSRSRFNRATMADRQVGSTFKTFVYLAAIENGALPDDPISNRPIEDGDYRPKNYDDRYSDFLTLEKAFAHSSNVASVRLYNAVGGAKVQQTARRLGLKADYDPAHASVALGTPSVSLMELTAAYAGIAANRYPVQPTGFRRPQPNLWDRLVEPPKAFSKQTHANMQRLLATSVESGTGRGAKLPMKAYGKTGTTQESRDSLFVGYASDLVVGVWVGRDDNRPNPGFSGGGVPARIWKDFMMRAHHLADAKPVRPAFTITAPAEAEPVRDDRQMNTAPLAQAPQIGR